VNYVGIDWAYGRAAFCAMGEGGEISAEGMIPADENGLARLVLDEGPKVKAAVEMMSGAVWVRDQLEASGWKVQVAHARKVRDVAPLACKTDKVDARVLAELCRRDLVPEVWVPPIEDRALRERLRRRMHLVKTRTSARNRIFGLLTQFGLRISYARLRKPNAIELLESRGVPEVWRASIEELLERRRARPAPGDDPGGGAAAQPHPRRRDRGGLPVLRARQAGRLRGPRSEGEPVG
jgi:transposase